VESCLCGILVIGMRKIAERSESNCKAILQSVTDGKKEYKMVQGNPFAKKPELKKSLVFL